MADDREGPRHWGVDVATRALDVVALGEDGRVVVREVCAPDDLDALARTVARSAHGAVVAIDAPDGWSAARHRDDAALPPKFRTARCGEIALRDRYGYAVSWPTPTGPGTRTGWMEVGLATHAALSEVARTVEVFPHAVFLHLAGRRSLPAKAGRDGARVRAGLLAGRLDLAADELVGWSVDARDALAAALVAREVAHGTAEPVGCRTHPGTSAIWLPASGAVPDPSRRGLSSSGR